MKVKVITKMAHEVDTDHITGYLDGLVQEAESLKEDYVSVSVFSLKDAIAVIEKLVADNQKQEAMTKRLVAQSDRLIDEMKTIAKQRDELADKLAELAAEKVKKSKIEPEPVNVECSQKAREREKATAEMANTIKEFNDWFFGVFGGYNGFGGIL